MRIGVATKSDLLSDAGALASAGFDYLELSMMAIAELSDREFDGFLKQYADQPLKVEVYQSMLPGELRLIGEHVNISRVRDYLCRTLDRMVRMGGEIVVLGSAQARRCPEGFDRHRGTEQLIEFVDLAATLLSGCNMRLGIEQIAPFETNMINTLREAEQLAAASNRENVGLVVDLAHLVLAGIDIEELSALKMQVLHAHIARPEGRMTPVENDGQNALYVDYIKALRGTAYNYRLSVETNGNTGIPHDRIGEAGRYLRGLVG